jgi:hypothetical protein
MANMRQNSDGEWKLKRHLRSIRENQFYVAKIILALDEDPPNAPLAKELLDELGYEGIDLWACSPKMGGG